MPGFFILIVTLFLRCSLSLFKRTYKSRQTAIDHTAVCNNRSESLSVVWSRRKSKWCVPFFLQRTNISSDLWAGDGDGDEPSSGTLFRYVVRDGSFLSTKVWRAETMNQEWQLVWDQVRFSSFTNRKAEAEQSMFLWYVYSSWVRFYAKRLVWELLLLHTSSRVCQGSRRIQNHPLISLLMVSFP